MTDGSLLSTLKPLQYFHLLCIIGLIADGDVKERTLFNDALVMRKCIESVFPVIRPVSAFTNPAEPHPVG